MHLSAARLTFTLNPVPLTPSMPFPVATNTRSMMVPVSKMRHVAFLLRAFCDHALVQAVASEHGAGSLCITRAKERFFLSPSAGGWRDLMLNFTIDSKC